MYLKLEDDSGKSTIYKMDGEDLIIGSGPTCRIVIKNTYISKKHLKISKEEDFWFIVDQGSTNGSYFGEEKLIPGKKYPFEVNESLRIGHQISLELVTEADSFLELPKMNSSELRGSSLENTRSDQDKTQIISIDELRNAKAIADENRKKIQAEKRFKELAVKKAERKRMLRIVFISAAILIVGIIANKKWKAGISNTQKETIINKIQTKLNSSSEIDADLEGYRIPREFILPRKIFLKDILIKKCAEDEAHPLCDTNSLKMKHNGVIIKGINTMIYLEEGYWLERAKSFTGPGLSKDNLRKMAFLIFLEDHSLELLINKKSHLFVIFYKYNNSKLPELTKTCAINAEQVEHLIDSSKKEDLEDEDEKVEQSFLKLGKYFTYY